MIGFLTFPGLTDLNSPCFGLTDWFQVRGVKSNKPLADFEVTAGWWTVVFTGFQAYWYG